MKKLFNLLIIILICCGFAHGGIPIPPAPPGTFALGGTLSGLENIFPAQPNAASINYLHQKAIGFYRLPIRWGGVNFQEAGGAVGIQPTPFGVLDSTSTYINNPPLGNNLVLQSQALATAPWVTFTNGTGTITRTNNAGIAPDGSNTATLIQTVRSDTSSFTEVFQPFTANAPSQYIEGVWLKACTAGDIGKVIGLSMNNGNTQVATRDVPLTNTWTLYPTSDNIDVGQPKYSYNLGQFGPGSTNPASVGTVCALAWGFQANLGSSLLPYSPTSGGYLQAIDSSVAQAATNGMNVIIDIHGFGNGPGLAGTFSISSITSSGTLATVTSSAAANLVNGATVTISGASDGTSNPPYSGNFTVFNVTGTTFQYTMASTPAVSPATGTIFGGEFATMGTPRLPCSALANVWGQISAHYKGVPGIRGYDLMNEPVNGFDVSVAMDCYQQAINAVRANGDTTRIYIEGVNFAGSWNWVTGQGQPFNNANLYQLTDSANNLIFSAHSYLDPDSSGTKYIASQVFGQPSVAPPGITVTSIIGVTRLTPFIQWCVQHQLKCHIGETGFANDPIYLGGVLNSAAWNLAMFNELAFAQQNNIEINIFAGGPGFGPATPYAGYPYNYEPSSISTPTQKDFTSAGLQSTQMVVLDKFTGFSGAQPQAYAISLPVDGSFNPIRYGSVGVASANFLLTYNAKIIAPITITPSAILMDGTSGGGTFTPSTVTFQPGDNATATVTYTPNQVATFQIGATNNGGLIDPPRLGYTSNTDIWMGTQATNIYGNFRQVAPYIGPAYRYQRSDGVQQDFFFNNRGDLPRQAIQDFLGSRSGIIAVEYDQSGAGNNKVPCQVSSSSCLPSMTNPPTLTLVNSDGYPEKTVTATQYMVATSPSFGLGQQSVLSRAKASNGGMLVTQDGPLDNFRMQGTASYLVAPNTSSPATVSLGSNVGAFASVAGTFSNLYSTNNVNGYQNGSLAASASIAPFTFKPNNSEADYYGFKFGSSPFVGSVYYDAITYTELSAATIAARATADATYYSTPLPDPLTGVPPVIAGIIVNQPIFPSKYTSRPFYNMAISDANPGATETITLTLSGAAGTLSGTGLSGSGPYTIGPDTPANVTTTIKALVFTTANTPGNITTFSIHVVSSAGSNTTNSSTTTVVTTYIAEIAFTPPGGTFTPVSATPQASKGYNLSGMENTCCASTAFTPAHFQLDYLASKGFSNLRLPFSTLFAFPTAFGKLDPTYLGAIKSVVDYAYSKNLYVILDPHQFGFIYDSQIATSICGTNAGQGNGFCLAAPSTIGSDLLADMWSRLATLFVSYPNVIFGLMNEPRNDQSAANWRDGGVIPSIAAIRATGATQLITIPGTNFTGAWTWTSTGSAAAFAGFSSDPGHNFAFEMHQYLDAGNAGSSPIAALPGATILDASPNGLATSWLAANGFQGVIYEFGIAPDPFHAQDPTKCYLNSVQTGASAPCAAPSAAGNLLAYDPTTGVNVTTNSLTQNDAMLTYMGANSAQWPGWSAWAGGFNFGTPPSNAGYGYNPEPQRNGSSGYVMPIVDQPQMPTLTSHL